MWYLKFKNLETKRVEVKAYRTKMEVAMAYQRNLPIMEYGAVFEAKDQEEIELVNALFEASEQELQTRQRDAEVALMNAMYGGVNYEW